MQISFTCKDSLVGWIDYEANLRNQSRSAFLELIVRQAADARGQELRTNHKLSHQTRKGRSRD